MFGRRLGMVVEIEVLMAQELLVLWDVWEPEEMEVGRLGSAEEFSSMAGSRHCSAKPPQPAPAMANGKTF